MISSKNNIDESEIKKFDALAYEWWNPEGPLRTLHDINSVRLDYINRNIDLSGKTVLDAGCGAGILCEAMSRKKAVVTGIDISPAVIAAAKQHAHQQGLGIDYQVSSPEDLAASHLQQFDIVTCMEMLEHVPNPASVINACVKMLKPGGHVFFSTINRTAKAWLFAVLGAEYILNLLPTGTHHYANFIKPSELAGWCHPCGLEIVDISGMAYHPWSHKASLTRSPDVNYLLHAILKT